MRIGAHELQCAVSPPAGGQGGRLADGDADSGDAGRDGQVQLVANIISIAVFRELGPLVSAVVLTGFAGATSRVSLGTGVVTVWTRHPATAAMAAGTVHDLSGGRMILGIGAGTPTGPGAASVGRSTPVALVEEFVRVVREAFSGEPVTAGPAGDPFRAAGFRSTLAVQPPPIWLAALGDRMLELTGRVADGVLLNWCPPELLLDRRRCLKSGP